MNELTASIIKFGVSIEHPSGMVIKASARLTILLMCNQGICIV